MIGDPSVLARSDGAVRAGSQRTSTHPRSVSVVRDLVNGRASVPLRIALIAPCDHPIRQPFAGGLESLVWQLRRALVARGHDVTLFAADGSDALDEEHVLPAGPWAPSRTASEDVSMPAPGFMAAHHAYLRLLMSLAGPRGDDFDLVHNHALHHLPVAMSPLVVPPMLTTLHTPPTPWLESAIELTRGDSGRGEFAAVSRFVARQWRVLQPDDEAHVVPNGVDLDTWKAGSGGSALVWSGRLVPEKAPHLAIEAARRAGLPLVLAGPVNDPEYFEAMVRPRLGRDVSYAGHLATPDLVTLIGSSAAALVTPVWDEPYGLVVAEALACGTPVVAFARGGIPEVLHDPSGPPDGEAVGWPGDQSTSEVGRLARPGDVGALAAAAADAVQLDRRKVRRHARQHLSLDRMVTAYEQLYDRLRSGATWESGQPA
ncbi:glycosyltransferase involved in cell wall biosynthesis [Humibacillus xanthopallidus]|uniref:Glycosyltransferase involved in cell wall biosynthesis n=1 Tax=Humibacillus xanthopallidus TaxID=412689 RepID=A0A543PWL9_9MICO|nr:glycosyltransferase [Humibacillus xanthopallidus]TQN48474.1 glycosyltransferase involved in cell wall biosynthesis [Humibacillus xanthopallidus]